MIFVTLGCPLLHLSVHALGGIWEASATMLCVIVLISSSIHARPFVHVLFRSVRESSRLLSCEVVWKSVEHRFTYLCSMRVGSVPVCQSTSLFNHCLFPQIHGPGAAIANYSISASRISHRFHFKNNCGLISFLKFVKLLSRRLCNIEIALLRISHAAITISRRRLGLRETQL